MKGLSLTQFQEVLLTSEPTKSSSTKPGGYMPLVALVYRLGFKSWISYLLAI